MSILSRPLMLALPAAVLLSACVPVNDPNNPNANAQRGALTGAAIGAAAGILTGDTSEERTRRAIVGAAFGAGVGGVAGAQLDRQEEELRAQMGSNAQIVNTGNELIVTLPQDILFQTDSAQLTGSLTNDLRVLASSLNSYPNTTVNVIGHTDDVGAEAYNQSLSQRRAQAVTSVLINSGVAPGRIRTIGRGESQPIASNATATGRQQNRRVEIIITPN